MCVTMIVCSVCVCTTNISINCNVYNLLVIGHVTLISTVIGGCQSVTDISTLLDW